MKKIHITNMSNNLHLYM